MSQQKQKEPKKKRIVVLVHANRLKELKPRTEMLFSLSARRDVTHALFHLSNQIKFISPESLNTVREQRKTNWSPMSAAPEAKLLNNTGEYLIITKIKRKSKKKTQTKTHLRIIHNKQLRIIHTKTSYFQNFIL